MVHDIAHATSAVGDSLIAVWTGDPSAARVHALAAELRGLVLRNRGRGYLYNLILTATPVPSAESRAALQAEFLAMRGHLQGAAIVLEKTGVEGTLSRAVLSTLLTITRQPFPMRVFPVRLDAASWLGSQGCTTSTSVLLTVADSLARGLAAPTAAPEVGASRVGK